MFFKKTLILSKKNYLKLAYHFETEDTIIHSIKNYQHKVLKKNSEKVEELEAIYLKKEEVNTVLFLKNNKTMYRNKNTSNYSKVKIKMKNKFFIFNLFFKNYDFKNNFPVEIEFLDKNRSVFKVNFTCNGFIEKMYKEEELIYQKGE